MKLGCTMPVVTITRTPQKLMDVSEIGYIRAINGSYRWCYSTNAPVTEPRFWDEIKTERKLLTDAAPNNIWLAITGEDKKVFLNKTSDAEA